MTTESHNPDVLSCLANLSNDEVFTPPKVVNDMLDLLPPELFRSKATTFLDIGCKSGVFLREIAKRLIAGLEGEMPDLQQRVDHILHKQLFGIATTELTSLVSRRTLYCSKYPNCRYSASRFDSPEGNIRFRNIPHAFVGGRCKWCGASEDQFGPKVRKGLETHAYEFIHTEKPEEIFKMKFDVIVGNPPYQLDDGGNGVSASPIYQLFVQQSKKLCPRFIVMIMPSRWFTGGKGLDDFRDEMLKDKHISRLVDFVNAKDCFPGCSIGGGVCYFLWNRDKQGPCEFTNIHNGIANTAVRELSEYDVFVRYNEALSIVHKASDGDRFSEVIGTRNPFGIPSNGKGNSRKSAGDYTLFSRDDITYVHRDNLVKNQSLADQYKIMMSRFSAEHAGEPDKDGMFKILSRTEIICPGEICTDTYLVVGGSKLKHECDNMLSYLRTKFVRFLLLQGIASISITKEKFQFVPLQDFSKPWTDAELYKKYKLTKDEIAFIESMIKPME